MEAGKGGISLGFHSVSPLSVVTILFGAISGIDHSVSSFSSSASLLKAKDFCTI